jgi:hypothetical protein
MTACARLGALATGVALALVLVLACSGTPARAADFCPGGYTGTFQPCHFTGSYGGSWTVNETIYPPPQQQNAGVTTIKATMDWSEHWTGSLWQFDSASGNFSVAMPGPTGSCSSKLSLGLGSPWGQTPGTPTTATTYAPGLGEIGSPPAVFVALNVPLVAGLFTNGGNCDLSGLSRFAPWSASFASDLGGAQCHWKDGADQWAFAYGTSYTQPDNCTGQHDEVQNDGTHILADLTLTQTISFASPGGGGQPVAPTSPTSPVLAGPFISSAKRNARADLPAAIDSAAQYCIPLTGAGIVAGAGLLTVGTASGGLLAGAGTVVAEVLAPFCTATVTRLVKDYRAYRDPPYPDIRRLARPARPGASPVAACARGRGAAATLCRRLRPAGARLVDAARAVAADATAIETTVGRESAAIAARDAAAVALQDGNLRTLGARRVADGRALTKAGAGFARALRSAGVGLRLTRAQSSGLVAKLRARLTGQGLTRADQAAVPGLATGLRPRARDVVAGLRGL